MIWTVRAWQLLLERPLQGEYKILMEAEMRTDRNSFHGAYHITPATFQKLVQLDGPHCTCSNAVCLPQDHQCCQCMCYSRGARQSPGCTPCSPPTNLVVSMACAGGSGVVVEAVRPGSSMSGQQQQQQQQPASGVGRRRHGGKNHLEAGSSVHRGESKFECQQCDKTFVSRRGLKYHTLTHSGVRNYECVVLEIMSVMSVAKDFLPFLVSINTFRHTGLREFKCDVCGKCFKTKADIAKHMRIHF
ncbi:zinc finger protein 252-like [Scylla paramamosain]|uniref:zinc finger protein 252-like n=1 Tax=Scylla paramamosain TaxID=85552 RepID=UPI003082EDD4